MVVCARPEKPPFSPRDCAGDPGIIGIIPKRSSPDCNLISDAPPPLIGSMQLNVLPPVLSPPNFGCVLPLVDGIVRESGEEPEDDDEFLVGLTFEATTVEGSTDPCDLKLSFELRLPPLVFDMDYETWPGLVDAEIEADDWVLILGKLDADDWASFPIECGGGSGPPGCDGPRGWEGPTGPSTLEDIGAQLIQENLAGTNPVTGDWTAITVTDYASSRFVIVGNGGVAARSSNGTSWVSMTVPSLDWLDVAAGSGRIVAVNPDEVDLTNENTNVIVSANGVGFAQVVAPPGAWATIEHIDCLFIAVSRGGVGATSNRIMTSEDGLTWTVEHTGTEALYAIGGGFEQPIIAMGDNVCLIRDSNTGTWSTVGVFTPPGGLNWRTLNYNGSQWIAGSDTQDIAITADPTTTAWSVTSSVGVDVDRIIYAGGAYVVPSGEMSHEGIEWFPEIEVDPAFVDMVYWDKILYTVANSTLLRAATYTIHLGNYIIPVTGMDAAPPTPEEGDIYFDSVTKKHYGYDGTTWNAFY